MRRVTWDLLVSEKTWTLRIPTTLNCNPNLHIRCKVLGFRAFYSSQRGLFKPTLILMCFKFGLGMSTISTSIVTQYWDIGYWRRAWGPLRLGWECLQFQSILSFDIEMLGNLGQVEDEIEVGVGMSLTSTYSTYIVIQYWDIGLLKSVLRSGLRFGWECSDLRSQPISSSNVEILGYRGRAWGWGGNVALPQPMLSSSIEVARSGWPWPNA